ncbi:hypothetical protein CDIK_3922 [Cucumispora dikerogammari]|nr:hypothetical protein CDIK_3922 [Cucumispora dikerogammari]
MTPNQHANGAISNQKERRIMGFKNTNCLLLNNSKNNGSYTEAKFFQNTSKSGEYTERPGFMDCIAIAGPGKINESVTSDGLLKSDKVNDDLYDPSIIYTTKEETLCVPSESTGGVGLFKPWRDIYNHEVVLLLKEILKCWFRV